MVAPATKGGRRQAAFILAPQGAHLPSGAVLYNSRERSPQPVRKAEPIPDRTLGARGESPGGAINPRGEAASTFGNTVSTVFSQKPTASGAAADRRHLYWRRKAPYLPSGAVLYNSLGRQALKLSGRRSRSRTEPLAPGAKAPAAPSTLAAKPRQPSGIQ